MQQGAGGDWNRLRFMGREYDAETGLYRVRARYYDPELRRFVSEDPIGLAGGLNLHAYAGNDPINLTDPSGLAAYRLPRLTVVGRPFPSCDPRGDPALKGGDAWAAQRAIESIRPDYEELRREAVGVAASDPAPKPKWQTDEFVFQVVMAVGNVALDVSGTRALTVAGVQAFRIGRSGKGMAVYALEVFGGKAGVAITPTPLSMGFNSTGFVGGAVVSGRNPNGLDFLKFGAGFVPVIGSIVAFNNAVEACRGS